MQQLDIGVVLALGQDARYHPPLLGNAEPAIGAQLFEIDPLLQNAVR